MNDRAKIHHRNRDVTGGRPRPSGTGAMNGLVSNFALIASTPDGTTGPTALTPGGVAFTPGGVALTPGGSVAITPGGGFAGRAPLSTAGGACVPISDRRQPVPTGIALGSPIGAAGR
ncbi:hypothetical protein AB0I81_41870 [Nonomuraea sp. NPDC050404]|uniref:hypothetical protein n=1 Tax=Nonomuraea sp. NPDC050404 TaxID=3155783 RepID=UPI0033C89ED9